VVPVPLPRHAPWLNQVELYVSIGPPLLRFVVGERATAEAVGLTRQALRALECLVSPDRRLELRVALEPAALRLDWQLVLFALVLPEPVA
jgi:hypothetical protein